MEYWSVSLDTLPFVIYYFSSKECTFHCEIWMKLNFKPEKYCTYRCFITFHFTFFPCEDALSRTFTEATSDNTVRLVFTDIRPEDSGVYLCLLDTSFQEINITVACKDYCCFCGFHFLVHANWMLCWMAGLLRLNDSYL